MNTNLAYADIERSVAFLPSRQLLRLQMKISELLLAKNQFQEEREPMSNDEARSLFEQFSGSIAREIDYKTERESWRDEKYGYSS